MPDKKSKKPKKDKSQKKKKKRRSKKRTKQVVNTVKNTATNKAAVKRGSIPLKPKPSPASTKSSKKKTSSKGKNRSVAPAGRKSKSKSKPKTVKGKSLPKTAPKAKQISKSLSKGGGASVRKENKRDCKEKENPPLQPLPPRLPEEPVETILIAPEDYLPIYSYKAPPKRTTTPKVAPPKMTPNTSAVNKRDNGPPVDPRDSPKVNRSVESITPPADPRTGRYTDGSRQASHRSRKDEGAGRKVYTEVEESGAEDEDQEEGTDDDEDVVEVNSSDDGGED